MSYRGQFKQGVVIFDTPPPLHEGAVVEVEPVDRPTSGAPAEGELPAWGEVLKDFIGKATGLPADMARNHDHYIHGAQAMTAVFADTVFFLALLNEKDEFRERAAALSGSLRRPIVTTAWVLTELADGLADTPGRILFQPFVSRFKSDSRAQIVAATQDLLDSGIELYHQRPDKQWSLTDCISFLVMQRQGIREALTADHHFEQAGFEILLK